MKTFLLRGLAAGASGARVAAMFLRVLTETQISWAIRFEDATGLGSRPGRHPSSAGAVQHLGGMAAAVIYGMVLGVVLGFTVAAAHHLLTGRNEFQRVAKVAGAAFVAVVVMPSLKYRPNPPTVGDPDTIDQRTMSYLLLMAFGVAAVFAALYFWRWVSARGFDGGKRFLAVAGLFVALVGVAYLVFPASPDPIRPPNNEAAPALVVAEGAPPTCFRHGSMLPEVDNDGSLRDPDDPSEELDLSTVDRGEDLVGTPVAVGVDKLVPHVYTTLVWNFRVLSLGRARADVRDDRRRARLDARPEGERAVGNAVRSSRRRPSVRRRGGRGRRCRPTGAAASTSPGPRSGGCAPG